jgi:outer membrane protein OmpA-like peptidoglycan-associated protein
MKKVLFLFITASCLFQIQGFSQKAQVGIAGGASVSNVYGRLGGLDNRGDSRTGFTAGLVVDAPIKKSNISFQPGIHYVQKGKYTLKTEAVKEADALRYADLLLNFVAYIGKPGKTRLFIGLGPQLGFNLPSKKIREEDGVKSELRSINFGNTAAADYRGIDYGANGLLGIRFRSDIFFSVNYTFGLRNLIPEVLVNGDDHLRNGSLGFRLGYFFKNASKPVVPPVVDRDGDGVPDNVDACPDVPGPAATQGCPDTDGDGILDKDDKCPTVKGIAKYDGCPIPDTDKDGINDEEDKCPTVPGVARYQGCPIPDTDKDGINDEEDKCPTVPGVARYQGCPIPDTDGDGVNDEEDRCVTIPGVKENYGCPIIPEEVVKRVNIAARNILFVTGSAKLQSKSFKGLNDVAKILNENPGMSLAIDGHTDYVGSDESNQTLSDNRAGSVKAYIVSKGVDESRITATGHGETMPIADNKTAAGRQQNRRSELTLSYYK